MVVSIHAPARGATLDIQIALRMAVAFQSTRPRGARRIGFRRDRFQDLRFNPRAREGRDTWSARASRRTACFNPRAREGRDIMLLRGRLILPCFNPRAREGRDQQPTAERPASGRFNPRAREGRDCIAARKARHREQRFNPRAREGRDPIRCRR